MAETPYVEVLVSITLDGPDRAPVVLELDAGGRAELTTAQARAIASDLEAMADKADGLRDRRRA